LWDKGFGSSTNFFQTVDGLPKRRYLVLRRSGLRVWQPTGSTGAKVPDSFSGG